MIEWKRCGNKKIPEPKLGVDPEFDNLNTEINSTRNQITEYLQSLQRTVHKEAKYHTSQKFRYEIELPSTVKVDENEFDFTSQADRKKRYRTDHLSELVERLEEQEERLNNSLSPFLRNMFRQFYKFRRVFQNAVSCVAELDCLNSLASVSAHKKMCKPQVLPYKEGERPVMQLKQLRHPCADRLVKKFVPNDVEFRDGETTLLITGPNMGGKSTLLRQTCLAAVMAQIGCYVPAS